MTVDLEMEESIYMKAPGWATLDFNRLPSGRIVVFRNRVRVGLYSNLEMAVGGVLLLAKEECGESWVPYVEKSIVFALAKILLDREERTFVRKARQVMPELNHYGKDLPWGGERETVT